MLQLIDLITQKFVQLAGLAALCLLVWFIGPAISVGKFAPLEPVSNRLIAIALVIVGWTAYTIYKHVSAGKKDKALMSQIAASGQGSDRAAVEEAQSEEVANLRRKFEEALRTLKSTQSKGGRSKRYLYELPWYVIIGGPGTGKTTLLRNSGLKFPLADRFGGDTVRGVGGTRDCDWFFTDQAIFLDTAGRYTTQDSFAEVDKAAWNGFLDLLKKNRPLRPINGVLLVMSLSDLLQEGEEERRQRARGLRQRIMELYSVLGNRFPIYMIFTKCDLVAGFSDFFFDMNQEDKNQVWGETFQAGGSGQLEKNLSGFADNFDVVLSRMRQQVLKRMQQERDVQRRGLIMSFPRQLVMFKPMVSAFLLDVFGSSRYETEPLLRGVYFTSATQEGTPIDRMMGSLAKTYGLDRQDAPIFSGHGKSFFITRLLSEVMFPEADLAGIDHRMLRRSQWLRWASYAALSLLVAGMTGLWSLSYYQNKQAIAKIEEQINKYRKILVLSGENDSEAIARVMVDRLNGLSAARGEYPPYRWTMGFGLYQGDKIGTVIGQVYQRRLMAELLPEINRRLKTHMGEVLQQGANGDSAYLYELLRAYLMLGLPDKRNKEVRASSVKGCWERDFPRTPVLAAQLTRHSDYLLKRFTGSVILDQELVNAAQQKLKSVPIATQIYTYLKSQALADNSHDFRLIDVIPPASRDVFTTVNGKSLDSIVIPGFFTADGYNKFFREKGEDLVREALQQSWVLNLSSERIGDVALLYDDLEKLYFAEYEIEWRKLLSNLQIRKPRGLFDSLRLLDHLSGPANPLIAVLKAVEKNTSLVGARMGGGAGANGKPGGSGGKSPSFLGGMEGARTGGGADPARQLADSFQPLNRLVQGDGQSPAPVADVIKRLSDLRDVLMKVTSGAQNEEQALKFAQERMQGVGAENAIKNAGLDFANLPEPLKSLLQSLTSSALGHTMHQARSELNNVWRTDVLTYYKTALQGRYPLAAGGRYDATIVDFSRFFAPSGIMDRFFSSYLKSFVDTTSPVWRQASVDSQSMHISDEALRQFQYAAKIRDAFFAPGETSPNVRFELKPVDLDANAISFQISIDGQAAVYSHGPPISTSFQWPGPHPDMGVAITVMTSDHQSSSSREQGPWGFFKLLNKADIERTSLPDLFIVTFRLNGLTARYELRAGSVYNPFTLTELKKFRCPEAL